jgi:hypothetical protein
MLIKNEILNLLQCQYWNSNVLTMIGDYRYKVLDVGYGPLVPDSIYSQAGIFSDLIPLERDSSRRAHLKII